MVDFISSIHIRNGEEITRGKTFLMPNVSSEELVVKNIVADSGCIEIIAAPKNNDFNLHRIHIDKFEALM